MSFTFNTFEPFTENLAKKVFNLHTDTLKVALTNSAPAGTESQLSSITQISAGNGYSTGGATVPSTSVARSGGDTRLHGSDVTWTAGPSSMAAFRYAVLYDDTATNDELIGWWDFGSALTITNGLTFTIDIDPTNGITLISKVT